MTSFRRLPPFLRALRVFWMLALLAAMGVLTWTFLATRSADQAGASRGWNRGMALFMAFFLLSMVGNEMFLAYNLRVERPARRALWPDTWQAQLKVTLALAALPLCSLVFTLLVPPSSSLFPQVFLFQIFSLLVQMAGYSWVFVRAHG